MAYKTIASGVWWGDSPTIYFTFAYDKYRSGADMYYKIKTTMSGVSGAAYFGYNIVQYTNCGGATNQYWIKDNSPSQWSSYSRETPWLKVSNKTSGSVPLSINIFSSTGSSRNITWNYTLDIDPAAAEISVADFDVDEGFTPQLTIFNEDFTNNLSVSLGDTLIKSVEAYTSGAVTFTTAELNTIYGLMSTVKSAVFSITVSTYSGETLIGSNTAAPTGSISNANPIIPAVYVRTQDANDVTYALTGNRSKFIKGYSTLKLVFYQNPSAVKGASIVSFVVNGVIYPYVSNFFLLLENYDQSSVDISVIDSRQNSASLTRTLNLIDYTPLTATSQSYKRDDNDVGEQTKFRFEGTIFEGSFGAVDNAITTTSYTYKNENSDPVTGSTVITPTVTDGVFKFNDYLQADGVQGGFNVDDNYTVAITVSDKLSSLTITYLVFAGTPAVKIKKNLITALNFSPQLEAPNPLPVKGGGTGAISFPEDSFLLGSGTSALQTKTADEALTLIGAQKKPVLLWENASPNSSFANQTVSVPTISAYTYIAVFYKINETSTAGVMMAVVKYATNAEFYVQGSLRNDDYNPHFYTRPVTLYSDSVTFGKGYLDTTEGYHIQRNTVAIPVYIYGIL